jgi:hypothetical protein
LLLSSRGAIKTWIKYSDRVEDYVKNHASNEGLSRLYHELTQLERSAPVALRKAHEARAEACADGT